MLNKLILQNWKSHFDSSYEFSPGVNVIIGPMGAGKSSIFQAITFALFGSLPEIKSRDVKTTQLVNRHPQAKKTKIKLLFSNEQEFAAYREIDKEKGTGNATVRNSQDQLVAGPKPTGATAFVEEILKTDIDTFLRTVYAKQNEIDLFLKYSPADRKKYIDELMKLDKFETARKYSTKLQNKIKTRLEENQKLIQTTDADKLKQDITQLSKEISSLEKDKKTASAHIEKAKNNQQVIKGKLESLKQKKSVVDKLEQKLNIYQNQIQELEAKLKDVSLESDKQAIVQRISELKANLRNLKTKKQEIHSEIEELANKKLAVERQLAVLDNKKKDLENRDNEVKRLNSEIDEIDKRRPSLEQDLEQAKKDKKETNQKLQAKNAEVNNIIEHLSELQQADSVCPVCTTALTDAKKKELVETRKKEIIELNKSKSKLSAKLTEIKKELENLKELAKKKDGLQERIKEVEKARKKIASALGEKPSVEQKKNQTESKLKELKAKESELEKTLEKSQSEINKLTEQKSLYDNKEQLKQAREKKSVAETKLAELSFDQSKLKELESQHEEAVRKTQEVVSRQENIASLLSEKHKRLLELKSQQGKLAKLEKTIASGRSKSRFLTKFNNALLSTQEALRIDLISTVNEVMSNIWADLYPYEKWQDIKLEASDSDYNLQICNDAGEWVSVAGFASGGERMLAALALRIAFAKVLAPHLSMLILDEPTHNLDEKAINTFLDILQNKLADYLDQLFIITHDQKLAEVGNVVEV